MSIDLDRLEVLARAASPGPWEAQKGSVIEAITPTDEQWAAWSSIDHPAMHAITGPADDPQSGADAAFIAAANPAAVLELIKMVTDAKANSQAIFDQLQVSTEILALQVERAEAAEYAAALSNSYITKMNLKPGDILKVETTPGQFKNFWMRDKGYENLKDILPEGVQVMIYPQGCDISRMEESVIRKAGWVRTDETADELAAFKAAAQTFVDRVRRGEVRSKNTYATFVKLLGEMEEPEPRASSPADEMIEHLAKLTELKPLPEPPTHFDGIISDRRKAITPSTHCVDLTNGMTLYYDPREPKNEGMHKASDAQLDELIAQVEAAGTPQHPEPKAQTLIDWIRARMLGGYK